MKFRVVRRWLWNFHVSHKYERYFLLIVTIACDIAVGDILWFWRSSWWSCFITFSTYWIFLIFLMFVDIFHIVGGCEFISKYFLEWLGKGENVKMSFVKCKKYFFERKVSISCWMWRIWRIFWSFTQVVESHASWKGYLCDSLSALINFSRVK